MASRAPDLRKLSDIISRAVDQIEAILAEKNLDFPSLDASFSVESEVAREIPEVIVAANLIASAAVQLASVARTPAMTIMDLSLRVRIPGFLFGMRCV
jgi:hypothetical protein